MEFRNEVERNKLLLDKEKNTNTYNLNELD